MRSVMSVTWGLSSMPDEATSLPRSVRTMDLSVTTFSAIMPWRPFRSLMTLGSTSDSGTGASAILERSSSSGILEPSMSLPVWVRTIVFTPSSARMSARPFLLSQPTAILPMPSGMAASMSAMGMLPPLSPMTVMATLSGRPTETADPSART